jgi:aminoglycoside phosphotransferase (APT) family kinase protein
MMAGTEDWVRAALGPGWTIRRLTPLEASSSTVIVVDLEREASARTVVLRVHDRAWFFDEDPEALEREVAALTLLTEAGIPAPRLVAWSAREPTAVLMTRVAGAPDMAIPDPGVIRDILDRIHGLPPKGLSAFSYRGYHEGLDLVRPPWWGDPGTWDRAVRQTEANRPPVDPVVIHRDFHPGNVLWLDGRLSGVVDWAGACLGPAAFDTSHMRVNLAVLHGQEEADRLFAGDPAWDVEAALGFLDWSSPATISGWVGPWPHIRGDLARGRLEAFVSEALARLG